VNQVSAFLIFWCVMVAIITVVSVAWAINDLKRGSARFGFFGQRVQRAEEPFEFWIAVGSKFVAAPMGVFMIWFALSGFASGFR